MPTREFNTNFQNWLLEHDPGEEMIYRKGWWDTYIFIRERVIPMLNTKYDDYKNLKSEEYFRAKKAALDSYVEIVGTHMSKSLVHPVLKITYKGVTFVFRYNFYDYEIMVHGDVPIILPPDLMYTFNDNNFFYEGIPQKYILRDKYYNGATTFAVGCADSYRFYAFLVIMKATIDAYKDKIVSQVVVEQSVNENYIKW